MKKTLIAVLAAALVGNLAFAQVSRTSESTAGLFGNDTDSFMSVNDWQDVKPENLFATMYYDNSALSLGVAHNFEKFYLGVFGYGIMPELTSEKATASGTTTTTNTSETHVRNFGIKTLFGLSDLGGIKLSFDYTNNDENKTVSINDKKTGNKNYDMDIRASYGFNSEWKGKNITPNFELYYVTETDKTFDSSADPQVTSDASVSFVGLSAGTGIELPKKRFAEQNVGLKLDTAFVVLPKENANLTSYGLGTYVKQNGAGAFGMTFTPDYTATFTPSEKMKVKVNAGLPVSFTAINGPSSVTVGGVEVSIDGDDRFKGTVTGFAPTLSAAMVYDLKESFQLNAGASFELGSLSITTAKGSGVDETYTEFTDTNKPVTFSSGFAWKPVGGKVVVDCSYAILADLFGNNLTTNLSTGTTSIWNNLNRILVHNVTIGLSGKF